MFLTTESHEPAQSGSRCLGCENALYPNTPSANTISRALPVTDKSGEFMKDTQTQTRPWHPASCTMSLGVQIAALKHIRRPQKFTKTSVKCVSRCPALWAHDSGITVPHILHCMVSLPQLTQSPHELWLVPVLPCLQSGDLFTQVDPPCYIKLQ